jgi:hypothetical protein
MQLMERTRFTETEERVLRKMQELSAGASSVSAAAGWFTATLLADHLQVSSSVVQKGLTLLENKMMVEQRRRRGGRAGAGKEWRLK